MIIRNFCSLLFCIKLSIAVSCKTMKNICPFVICFFIFIRRAKWILSQHIQDSCEKNCCQMVLILNSQSKDQQLLHRQEYCTSPFFLIHHAINQVDAVYQHLYILSFDAGKTVQPMLFMVSIESSIFMHPVTWELVQKLQALCTYVTVSLGKIGERTSIPQAGLEALCIIRDKVKLAVTCGWDKHSMWACCKSDMQNHIADAEVSPRISQHWQITTIEVNTG